MFQIVNQESSIQLSDLDLLLNIEDIFGFTCFLKCFQLRPSSFATKHIHTMSPEDRRTLLISTELFPIACVKE